MKLVPYGALVCLGVALPAAAGQAPPQLPDAPGKELVLKLCSGCHSAEKVVTLGRSREDWEATVSDMVVQRGAKGSEEEFYEVIEYLAKHFPKSAAGEKSTAGEKIHVNKATARELESALELSRKEAEAIVRFRGEKGDFKSIEELKKVPGLEAKKIDSKKNRLVFD